MDYYEQLKQMKVEEGKLRDEELAKQNEKKEQQRLKSEAETNFRKNAKQIMDETIKPIVNTIIHKLTDIGYKAYPGQKGITTVYADSPATLAFTVEYGTCWVQIDVIANVSTQTFNLKPTFHPDNIKINQGKNLKIEELTETNIIAYLLDKVDAMKTWEQTKHIK